MNGAMQWPTKIGVWWRSKTTTNEFFGNFALKHQRREREKKNVNKKKYLSEVQTTHSAAKND